MNRKLKFLFLLGIASGLLWSESIGSDKQGIHPVSLDVYDGSGSLLLHWSFADTIQANEINIYKRSTEEQDFSLISKVSIDVDRYLDKRCESLERYFYIVEIKDDRGYSYKSDDIRPAFGTSLVYSDDDENNLSNSIWGLMSQLIKDSFIKYFPEIKDEINDGIVSLLSNDNIHKGSWIENFPLQYLADIRLIMENSTNMVFQNHILEEMKFYEKKYRNELLLTPEEWNKAINNQFFSTKDKWYLLVDSFQSYSDQIENVSPLLISGAGEYHNNLREILIFVFDPDQLGQKKVSLHHDDENIEIEIIPSLLPGSEMRIKIPSYWEYAQLLIEGQIVDKIDFIANKKIMKTLDKDIIPVEFIKGIKSSRENTDIWLNEILWDPSTDKLSLEVAGIPSGSKNYIVSINNDNLWEVDLDYSFDIQYSDSAFHIDLSNYNEPIVLYYDMVEGSSRHTIEMIKLSSADLISFHRFPDGEKWNNTNKNTFGSENIDQRSFLDASLIPELFVLYQNYPNPFNSNTRISFDLLQDAILSLYVTDATGRVKTIFADKEFYNSGKYNFDWNAESFSTGVYFFTINAEVDGYLPVIFSRKMIYLK